MVYYKHSEDDRATHNAKGILNLWTLAVDFRKCHIYDASNSAVREERLLGQHLLLNCYLICLAKQTNKNNKTPQIEDLGSTCCGNKGQKWILNLKYRRQWYAAKIMWSDEPANCGVAFLVLDSDISTSVLISDRLFAGRTNSLIKHV